MGAVLEKLYDMLYSKKLEIVLVGIENAGKTTLLNVLANGEPMDTCPTIGLNVKLVRKGMTTMKCWDLGGQSTFRDEWNRYAKGCDCILYVVDASDFGSIATSKIELHRLLEDRDLANTPILVAANKIDVQPHMDESELIKELNLDYIVDQPWVIVPVSALRQHNIDRILTWLTQQAK